jgi:cobalt-precorrin 5A hydrolase
VSAASMSTRKPFAIWSITKHGIVIGERLAAAMPGAELLVSQKLFGSLPESVKATATAVPLPLGPVLADLFTAYDCHVFVISVGAVVRLVAPFLKDKKVDPAVICVDDAARFAICTLSGHVGRGNAYTDRVAEILGATSVVTTASDVLGTLTVDILGRELGWTLDDLDRNVTAGCAAVVNSAPVAFVQEAGEPNFWPLDKDLPANVRYGTTLDSVDPGAYEMLLIASDRDLAASHHAHWQRAVIYRPRSLIIGLGCDRGIPSEVVARGVDHLLATHGLSAKSVAAIATIDKKADEVAFLELAQARGWPLRIYAAEELDAAAGIENPSATVQRHVGTRGVAEPAALLAAGASSLTVAKTVYTEPGVGRSMTFAVARVPHPPREVAASRRLP